MADGLVVPGFPDGMGAFRARDGRIVLIRNHELESKGDPGRADRFRRLGPFGPENELFPEVEREKLYDAGVSGTYPSLGGTTTLVLDPDRGETSSEFMSLAGTERNCAGGVTPWGTWLTCEESVVRGEGDYLADHGYAFEVAPTVTQALQTPRALEAMGRFRREAVAVDPGTGVVYQTEDLGDGLFYRFIPKERSRLAAGGRLQALALVEQESADTRNWEASSGPALPEGAPVDVRWVDLDEVASPNNDLRYRGHAAGAAVFARGEGIWFGEGECYFACTNGGAKGLGQIFRLSPGSSSDWREPDRLELYIESTGDNLIRNADNLTIAPWGDLIVCEDRSVESHLRGVTADGTIYTLGRNALNGTEFAGACFAPGSSTLFVNIQKPGLTLAIDGPWLRAG